MNATRLFVVAVLLLPTGCPVSNSELRPEARAADAGAAGQPSPDPSGGNGGYAGGAGAAGGSGGGAAILGATSGKPLAAGCAANSECASGFCVNSVCCDGACDGQCALCNLSGTVGYCTAQTVGDDTTSAEQCTGAHTCSFTLPGLSLPICRLKDLQACQANADCASLNCATYYVDADRDGYGQTSRTLHLCAGQGATPPVGYVTQGGDCCDSDANSHPGQGKYFLSADACGSFDYDCDGSVQGSNGAYSEGIVPAGECGQTLRGSCTTCTQTISCH